MQKYINTIVKKALDEDLLPSGEVTTNLIRYEIDSTIGSVLATQDRHIAALLYCIFA